MITDLAEILVALAGWSLFSITQGYYIGSVSNFLSFRTCSLEKKLALSAVLSITIMPVIFYYSVRLGGLLAGASVGVVISLLSLVYFLAGIKVKLQTITSYLKAHLLIIIAVLFWIVYAAAMLIDLQINQSLFLSMANFDYAKHVAVTDSLCRNGIPPANPFFHPGHDIPIGYYYYWHLVAAVLNSMMANYLDTRFIVIAGTIWTGITLIALLLLSLRYFDNSNRPTVHLGSFALLLIPAGNIYLVAAFPYVITTCLTTLPGGSLNWWSVDSIAPVLTTMLWVPQHITSLIAGFVSSVCILELEQTKTSHFKSLSYILIAALGITCCIGSSIYIALGFTVTWLILGTILLCKKNFTVIHIIMIACLALLLSFPFIHELRQGHPGSIPLCFSVRQFGWCELLPEGIARNILNFVCLPLNYLCGFGAVFVLSSVYLRKHSIIKLSPKSLFLTLIFFISLVLATFVRSTLRANDFGWRVLLISQFVGIIWGARIMHDLFIDGKANKKLVLFVQSLVILGILSVIYDSYLCRFTAFKFDGYNTYQIRCIYEKLNNILLSKATIQHNPNTAFFFNIEPFYGLYSHHPTIVSDNLSGRVMQPYKNEYLQVNSKILRLFEDISVGEAAQICHRFNIDILLLKRNDALWSKDQAWLNKYPVIAQNSCCKAFLINPQALNIFSGHYLPNSTSGTMLK